MQPKDLHRYIKATERTVVPATVATRVQGIGILRKLPKRLQHYIIERGSRTDPYMSFVVEPYAVFLAFEIVDMEAAERLLPPGYSLHPSAMFGDTPTAALRDSERLHRPYERLLGQPRGVLPDRREPRDRAALVDHRGVRKQRAQLRSQPRLHPAQHLALGCHDVVSRRGHRGCRLRGRPATASSCSRT